MNTPMTRQAWIDYLKKAVDEFDWGAEHQTPVKIVAYDCVCGRKMYFESSRGVVAPKREFVELTLGEFNDCLVEGDPCEALAEPEAWAVMQAVQNKLKEKNA